MLGVPIAFLPLNSTTPSVSLSTGAPAFLYNTKSGAEALDVSLPSNKIFSAVEAEIDLITGASVPEAVPTVS